MYHEKIIKRENGDKYRITAYVSIDTLRNVVKWPVSVALAPKGKRIFKDVCNTDSYTFRALSMDARKSHTDTEQLQHVTAEEIYQAKLDLWEKLKPSLLPQGK